MTVGFYLSYVAVWILLIFHTLVLLGLVRSLHQSQRGGSGPGEGVPVGDPIPEFSARDVDGNTVDNSSIAGRVTALLFASPDCSSCAVTLDELEALRAKTGGSVIVFCRAAREACGALAAQYGLSVPVVIDEDRRLSRSFGVTAPPLALLVDGGGRVLQQGRPMTPRDLERILAHGAGGDDEQHRTLAVTQHAGREIGDGGDPRCS